MTRHDSVFGRVGPGPAGGAVFGEAGCLEAVKVTWAAPGPICIVFIFVTYCTLHAARFCDAYVHVFLVG